VIGNFKTVEKAALDAMKRARAVLDAKPRWQRDDPQAPRLPRFSLGQGLRGWHRSVEKDLRLANQNLATATELISGLTKQVTEPTTEVERLKKENQALKARLHDK
jgi:hypothetical protein